MYDTMGDCSDYQVKCFPVPCFYYSKNSLNSIMLGYMGGKLRYFGFGCEVPVHTLWYKYPDDFIIIDTSDNDFGNPYIDPYMHIIKDKKYVTTTENCDDIKKYYDKKFTVIDRFYGKKIFIDAEDQIEELKYYIEENRRIGQKKKEIFDEYAKCKKDFFIYWREHINENFEEDPKYQELKKNYDYITNELEPKQLKDLTSEFNKRFFKKEDNFERIQLLEDVGGYIGCFENYKTLKHINKEQRLALCKEFKRRITENNIQLSEYLEWNEPEKEIIPMIENNWKEMLTIYEENLV